MFLLKKLISRGLFPLPLSLEIVCVGLYLLWFTRKQRTGKALVTFGTLLLTGLSYFFTANGLLRPLEHRYPPFDMASRGEAALPAVRFIMVLGARANTDPGVPVTSRVSSNLMVRLVEGVRLHRELAGTKLILSGNHGSAEGMAQVAEALGVSPQDVILSPTPRDTEQEAMRVAALLGQSPFILVTSAAHMPRALGLFRKRGLQPLPAPTDYLAPPCELDPEDVYPNAFTLFKSQTAVYEYLGLAWAEVRGKI
jgi:uncharacterized SAM-binding protein YcdF (DUF218 family)